MPTKLSKKTSVLSALAILGFAVGCAARALMPEPSLETHSYSSLSPSHHSTSPPTLDLPKSSDTLATLTELSPADLYPRLALWLLDASPSEIEQCWTHYSRLSDANPALIELILTNWTRLDPEAAIEATKDTQFATQAWTSWASHDPDVVLEKLLAHTQQDKDSRLEKAVFLALGKFHPAWLREHFDRIPESQKLNALIGYRQTADVDNPRESLDFLLAQNQAVDNATLAAFARQSPLEALELILRLKAEGESYYYPNQPEELINTLASQDPTQLDQLIPHLKSPQAKMQAQLAQFHALLKTDLAAAEKKSLETPSGWAKQDQLTALAQHHLHDNPEKARSLALLLLREKGNLFDRSLEIKSPGSSLSLNSKSPASKSLFADLISTDARALMNAVVTDDQIPYPNQHPLAHDWAQHDLDGFAQWVDNEAPPEARKLSAQTMTNILAGRERFDEAIEWANELPASSGHLSSTYIQWLQSDPEAARNWRKEASLNEEKSSALDRSEELVQSIQ